MALLSLTLSPGQHGGSNITQHVGRPIAAGHRHNFGKAVVSRAKLLSAYRKKK